MSLKQDSVIRYIFLDFGKVPSSLSGVRITREKGFSYKGTLNVPDNRIRVNLGRAVQAHVKHPAPLAHWKGEHLLARRYTCTDFGFVLLDNKIWQIL